MKILVFSDSHGKSANIEKGLRDHPDAEVVIHLGDGISDLSPLGELTSNRAVFTVNGNYEDFFTLSSEIIRHDVISMAGKNFFLCHGHRHLTSNYLGSPFKTLINQAVSKNCDVALFGHTHSKYEAFIPSEKLPVKRENGLYLFNPGSISRPRDGDVPSYGIIDVKENGILFSHALIGGRS